jgi:hypothetical protein
MRYADIENNVVVTVHSKPAEGRVEVSNDVYGGMIVVDGQYVWPEPTAEEKLWQLREERNMKLTATDWWASSDLTMTEAQTAYRQALRDITDTYTSLDDVVWPEVPNE